MTHKQDWKTLGTQDTHTTNKDSHVRRLLLALAAMMRLLAGLSSPDTKLAPILRRFRVASPASLSALLASSKVRPDRDTGSTWKMSFGSSSPCSHVTHHEV